jgi:DNA-binding MarR family transcriptional regulator
MQNTPTARLLIAALRAFEHALLERLHADGYDDVTLAQTNALRHLDNDGMRMVDFARDAGVTKQAISQMVKSLTAAGLVTVEPDPDDRRARRVVYTERGRAMIARAVVHVIALEQAWQAEIGEEAYLRMRASLARLAG